MESSVAADCSRQKLSFCTTNKREGKGGDEAQKQGSITSSKHARGMHAWHRNIKHLHDTRCRLTKKLYIECRTSRTDCADAIIYTRSNVSHQTLSD